jgi:hypothetical protein
MSLAEKESGAMLYMTSIPLCYESYEKTFSLEH